MPFQRAPLQASSQVKTVDYVMDMHSFAVTVRGYEHSGGGHARSKYEGGYKRKFSANGGKDSQKSINCPMDSYHGVTA
jgi:hypothetical protein